MDYVIEMKKEPVQETNLPKVRVPLGIVKAPRKYRENEEQKIRKMVEKFLKNSEYKADNTKWTLQEEEILVVKANPRVNSWKNSFEGKIFEGKFKIPEERRRQFNRTNEPRR